MQIRAEGDRAPELTAPKVAGDLAIEAGNLVRCFGETQALAGVSLAIRRGEFFSLLGPSGCGKTTLLRLIAGLDSPDAGTLKIGGKDATGIPAHQRPVNTVFQSYALFPHLNVRDNVAFGLRMKKIAAREIAERVERALALVQISSFAERRPAQLSGGQKQRVALARALVNEPEVLLLDEPLGALDLKLRKELQVELSQLQRRLGITFILVTHDQDEALAMSDRIAVMNAGKIEQLASARELYEQPRTRFTARFLGSCNLLEGRILRVSNGDAIVATPIGELRLNMAQANRSLHKGEQITLAIRPEKIRLASFADPPAENQFAAQVHDVIYRGAETQYCLRVKEETIHAEVLNVHSDQRGFEIGNKASVILPKDALIVLDD